MQYNRLDMFFQLQNTIGFVNWHRYILHCYSAIKIYIVKIIAIKLAE